MTRWLRPGIIALLCVCMAAPITISASQQLQPDERDALIRKLETLVASHPAERYEVDARAQALGPGLEKAFAFVRDDVRYEAYSGVLRDAAGALAAMAGNAFDRSLLLGRLLGAHDISVRYATCTLDQAAASRIFAGMFRSQPKVAAPGETSPNVITRVFERGARDDKVLRAAIGTALKAGGEARDQALKDISRHVWVQAQVNDTWIDLDSSFRDARPGTTFCTVEETVEAMPDEWFQHVTVRVAMERLEDEALTSTPVLEATFPASALLEQEVFLLHMRGAVRDSMALGVRASTAGDDEWTPVLLVGNQALAGSLVNFGVPSGTGVADAFSGGGGPSVFVSESIEFEIARPDGRTDASRRRLVDRASTAWRSADKHPAAQLSMLATDADGLVAPQAVHNILFSAGARNVRRHLGIVAFAALGPFTAVEPTIVDRLLPLAAQNRTTSLWTEHAIIPALNDDPDVRVYADTPRIVIVSATHVPGKGVREEFDLRHDSVFAVGRTRQADAAALEHRLRYGTLQGAMEHEFVAENAGIYGGDPATVTSTSSVLGRATSVAARRDVNEPEILKVGNATAWWEVTADGNARSVVSGLNGAYVMHPGLAVVAALAQAAQTQGQLPEFMRALTTYLQGGIKPAGNEYTLLTVTVVMVGIKATVATGFAIAYLWKKSSVQLGCLSAPCR